MKADVAWYAANEGGDRLAWPFPANVKPSNLALLTWEPGIRSHFVFTDRDHGFLRFHSIGLSDGAEWDAINGFRKAEWNVSH